MVTTARNDGRETNDAWLCDEQARSTPASVEATRSEWAGHDAALAGWRISWRREKGWQVGIRQRESRARMSVVVIHHRLHLVHLRLWRCG